MTRTKTWRVDVYLFEHAQSTLADAVLRTEQGATELRGTGTARWHSGSTPVPEICDELAAARALSDVAQRLREVAGEDVRALGGGEVQLTG